MQNGILAILAAAAVLAGCGRGGQEEEGRLKIGYIVNFMSHEWYQNICAAAEARAAELGVDLVIADANLDLAAQISKAENMIAQGVDVLALTPVDAKGLGVVLEQAREKGIRVLTESNPAVGAETYVGIDNKAAGRKAGDWFVEHVAATGIDPKVLVIGYPNFEDCRLRVDGFVSALDEAGLHDAVVQEVDGQGLKEKAFKVAQDALTAHPEVNVLFGINDDSTTGAMAAYRAAGLDESELLAIGFGFEGSVGRTALLGNTPVQGRPGHVPALRRHLDRRRLGQPRRRENPACALRDPHHRGNPRQLLSVLRRSRGGLCHEGRGGARADGGFPQVEAQPPECGPCCRACCTASRPAC